MLLMVLVPLIHKRHDLSKAKQSLALIQVEMIDFGFFRLVAIRSAAWLKNLLHCPPKHEKIKGVKEPCSTSIIRALY